VEDYHADLSASAVPSVLGHGGSNLHTSRISISGSKSVLFLHIIHIIVIYLFIHVIHTQTIFVLVQDQSLNLISILLSVSQSLMLYLQSCVVELVLRQYFHSSVCFV